MNVLVIGGAGYVGASLCEALSKRKDIDQVVIYDNMSRSNYNVFIGAEKLDDRFRFVEGDILDSRKLRKVMDEAEIVYHLAAKVSTPFADQDAHLFEQVNHWGTAEVCYAAENSNVKKLIYTSSVSVYGSGDESKHVGQTTHPTTFYGISKLRGEDHVRRLDGKLSTSILRCGNVFGYHKSMRFDAVINKFMMEANFQGKINIHGSGEQHRPFVHISHVTERLISELDSMEGSEITDLVDANYSVMEIAEIVKALYPDLEMIFINQGLKLRELNVKSDTENRLELLREQLSIFKEEFTF